MLCWVYGWFGGAIVISPELEMKAELNVGVDGVIWEFYFGLFGVF